MARSLKLWSFYCDLEESLGTLESTRAVYDQILELRIATPQIILNYALFLQVSSSHPCAWGLAPVDDKWTAHPITQCRIQLIGTELLKSCKLTL